MEKMMISRALFADREISARKFIQRVQEMVHDPSVDNESIMDYIQSTVDATEYSDRRIINKFQRDEREKQREEKRQRVQEMEEQENSQEE